MKKQLYFLSAIIVMASIFTLTAMAEPKAPPKQDLMPAVSPLSAAAPSESIDSETHPALNMSPDKSELVRLDREASSVIVGNPDHIAVVLDAPRLAVVIPRAAGATYFTVLDKDGNVIMQRHVIVAAPKKNYVRVRRSCGPDAKGCQATSVYFCPDMCHEIGSAAATGDDTANAVPAITAQ